MPSQIQFIPLIRSSYQLCTSGNELPESKLEVVQIYFDTASFDEIKRDKKIKFEAQLSLIGGTMGLLTGFSIISAVEILYYMFQIFFDLFHSNKK